MQLSPGQIRALQDGTVNLETDSCSEKVNATVTGTFLFLSLFQYSYVLCNL